MYSYDRQPLWSEQVWAVLCILSAFSLSFYLANCLWSAWGWLRARPWRGSGRTADPALFFYVVGLLIAAVTFISPFLFDRYLLPILPMLMLYPLRLLSAKESERPGTATVGAPARATLLPWLAIVHIALFSVLALHDYKEQATVRWEAAERLVEQGVKREQINAGFEWLGQYLFQEGVQYIHDTNDYTHALYAATAVNDPVYVLGEAPVSGYTQVGASSYVAWLRGGQVVNVLTLKRK